MLSHLRHDNGKGWFPTSSFLQPGLSHSCRFGLLELSLALLTVSAGSAPAADLGRCGYSACRVSSSQSDLGANVGSSSSSAAIISPLHFGSALRTAMAARISSIVLRSASCLQHSSTASLWCGIHLRKARGPYRGRDWAGCAARAWRTWRETRGETLPRQQCLPAIRWQSPLPPKVLRTATLLLLTRTPPSRTLPMG